MATWLIVILAVVVYLLAGGVALGLLSPELPEDEMAAGCAIVFIILLWPLGLAIAIGVWVRDA